MSAMIFSVVLCLILGGCNAASSAHVGSNEQLASLVESSSYTDSICRNIKADYPEDSNADHLGDRIDLGGVTVTLHDESGALVATTLTDSFGNYCFYQLALGNFHAIVENNPADDVVSGADEAHALETDKFKLRGPQPNAGHHLALEKLPASLSTETPIAPGLKISIGEVDRLAEDANLASEHRDLAGDLLAPQSPMDSPVTLLAPSPITAAPVVALLTTTVSSGLSPSSTAPSSAPMQAGSFAADLSLASPVMHTPSPTTTPPVAALRTTVSSGSLSSPSTPAPSLATVNISPGLSTTSTSLGLTSLKLPVTSPTRQPTKFPTKRPTPVPTAAPTKLPTKSPAARPTRRPTRPPTTMSPTATPTRPPTKVPTQRPTPVPTAAPTNLPTKAPTARPTRRPTHPPSKSPTKQPTAGPTRTPTKAPTKATPVPTKPPTRAPTRMVTKAPTKATLAPTKPPTAAPTRALTIAPIKATLTPTKPPTAAPTRTLTIAPTKATQPATKAPTQASPTSCTCSTPKKVPSECEVQFLIDLLEIAVSGQHKLSAQWLRLSFHDAGTFNKAVPEGGANGCLMNHPPMRLQDENGHLDIAINTLEQIRNNWEQLATTCIDISSADIIQFAGFFASVRQTGSVPGITTAKISQLLTFKWGRPDEVNCNINWTHNLPGFDLGTDSGNLPLRCKMAGKEIKTKMMDRNGFTAQEATALIGAHTIGLTRNVFGGLAAPWVADGADDATPSGPVFDNTFFDFMANKVVAKTTTAFGINPAPFTSIFPTWVQTSSPTTLNYLDTDLALAFPPKSAADHPDYHVNTVAFSKNNQFFLNTFHNAQTKMGMLGVTAVLSVPVPCPVCQTVADPITVPAVVKLVANLGDATSTADASLAVQQDAIKDQQVAQTTVVQSFILTENGTNTVEIPPA